MKLMIVDGNSILNRAFYGIRPLSAPDGTPTNAIYGFLNILNKYLTEVDPQSVAICFDVSRKTFRNELYADYKGNRKGMPEELSVQLLLIKEILSYLGFKTVGLEGFEADDLIGTLSLAASKRGEESYIITGDRDSLQLVDEHTTVLLPSTKSGKTETTVYNIQTVKENMGVYPSQIIDLKALMGDSSDNIPGVAGIGSKTAVELISRFESLEKLYGEFEESDLRNSVKEKLKNDREKAFLSQTLATINRSVEMDTNSENYKVSPIETEKAAAMFLRLGLFTMMEKYSLKATDANENVQIEETKQKTVYTVLRVNGVEEIFKNADEEICYLFDGIYIYAAVKDKIYITGDAESFLKADNKKVCYDVKSQYLFALRNNLEVNGIDFDVKLAAYLLDPSASDYSFSSLKTRIGESECELDFSLEFGENEEYILNVAALPFLYKECHKKLCEQNMLSLLKEIEIPLSKTLSSMEFEGFSVDADGLARFDKELSEALKALNQKIYDAAGCEFNLNSPKQLGEVLFEKLSLPAKKKTKTGYSTNAEVLNELRTAHPIVEDILEYRKISKLKSTYTEGILSKIGSDGRIHTTFLQTETRTGRLSSVEPNLQNIPVRTALGSRLREFFTAREGYVLVDADYSQIELRVLAHIANDKAMIEAFKSGADIHSITASKIHNLPLSMITPEVRRSAKAVNFGIVYGIGAFSLSQDIGVSQKEAKRLIESYLTEFSGVNEYMKKTVADGERDGFVATLYNRRRNIDELASKNKMIHALGERIAMNTPIQGTAADIIKIAMNKVFERLKKDAPSAKLILQVHDELIIECPENEAESVKMLLKEEMEAAANLSVRLESDVHIGKNWLIAKG